jgi:uncharacterized iron-regulated membrane protein
MFPERMTKVIRTVHLWLGLSTGLIVFIIAVTGCIYAFQAEIQDLTQPYRFVEPRNKPVLPPSRINRIAERALPGKHIHAVMYLGEERAARVIFWKADAGYYYFVYIDPYSGEVLKVKDELSDFFRIVLDGHYYLWLPPEIGQKIAASATLIFVILLITGLFLWWPRNKNGRKQRFRIKWNARWRRTNYDLHNVLGFYIHLAALILALTGLVWGFVWFRDAVYRTASGGDEFVEYYNPPSDPDVSYGGEIPAIDRVWLKMIREYPDAEWIEIHPPEDSVSSIAANANPDASTYWKTDYHYFDQYSLEELPVNHIWNRFGNSSGADKLMRMNYDIHVGAVLGFPGKLLAFFASLIIASLPITGFLLWYGRMRKKKKNMKKSGSGLSYRNGKVLKKSDHKNNSEASTTFVLQTIRRDIRERH